MIKNYILIVDDEKNVTRLLEKFFKKEGYGIYTAYSGDEALNIIDNHHVDVVITDIKMPGMNGMELLYKIKCIDSSIEIILITAFATVDTAVEALKMGAKDYIIKPFNLEEILLSVKKAVKNAEICNEDESLQNYFLSKSSEMIKCLELIKQVANTKATVIIYGETGTGKELAANAIHSLSDRGKKPFIKINCGAIPENLLESELFGYEKGSFTGAIGSKPGKFELADGGTIFLDEIGDITPFMQVKLLRILQEKEFERIGGIKTIKVDVRIIAATNKNLMEMVEKNQFRKDLYYRLSVVPMKLPPLRERREDIRSLIDYFLSESSSISGEIKKTISQDALDKLISYDWPGNIRELRNILERCVVIAKGSRINLEYLPDYIINFEKNTHKAVNKLDDVVDNAERDFIIKALKECDSNRTRASKVLGISRRSLHRKIIKYNIEDV